MPLADDDEVDSEHRVDEHRSATVLPTALASAISLVTATSSLSLRIGGFIGKTLIDGARVGTLTGFELGRTVLEGILSRAGRDVAATASGSIGILAAEGLLDKAVRMNISLRPKAY